MRVLNSLPKLGAISVATFVLVVFFAQGIFFIRANSPTVDEATHLTAGYSYLALSDFRLNPEHPPLIKEIQALPLFLMRRIPFRPDPRLWREGSGADYLIGNEFLYKSEIAADEMLAFGRLTTLVLGGSLIALIGWWAYRLWGKRAGLLALTMASLEPTLIAHSSLVTNDMPIALFIFLSLYLFWEYAGRPRWSLLVAVGVATGLAHVAKFSALLLIPLFALIVAASFIAGSGSGIVLPRQVETGSWKRILAHGALVLFVIYSIAVVAMLPTYFFQGLAVWWQGFESFLEHVEVGHAAFLLGEHYYDGRISYFPVAFVTKTSVGAMLLFLTALALYRSASPLHVREFLFLCLPALAFSAVAVASSINIGIRHLLPVYPFLFVLASRAATFRFRARRLYWLAIGAPLIWTAVSSFRAAPHQLAYFNELVGGPEQGYRYLSDSNIDWGQDLKTLKQYMEKEKVPMVYLSYFGTAPPSYYGIRYQYVPGSWPVEWPPPGDRVPPDMDRKMLAISVYNLQDVSNPYNPLFRWLWSRRPAAKLGYSIFMYDLTNDRDGLARLAQTYVQAGVRLP